MPIPKALFGLMFVLLALPACAADVLLTMNSYGSIRIGMNVDDAYRELKKMGREKLARPDKVESVGCGYYIPYAGLAFMTEKRRIVRIETQETDVVTPSGIRVGDSISKVRAKFGSRLTDSKQFYSDNPEDRTLVVVANDGKTAMRFEADRNVTDIYAGYENAIHFVEGCD